MYWKDVNNRLERSTILEDFFDRMAKGESPTEKDKFEIDTIQIEQEALILLLNLKRKGRLDEFKKELSEIGSAIAPSAFLEKVINDQMTVMEGRVELKRIRGLIRDLEKKAK